ncbi:MAG: hypothetical protein JRI25_15350 [Deltaproteobacteria bacterium]|nr:hypothetical protein [Deltaproteobacteria bacterium]
MARGITGFSLDLYRRGDVLERAVLALSRSIAVVALRICTITRVPNFLLLVHRSSNDLVGRRGVVLCWYERSYFRSIPSPTTPISLAASPPAASSALW